MLFNHKARHWQHGIFNTNIRLTVSLHYCTLHVVVNSWKIWLLYFKLLFIYFVYYRRWLKRVFFRSTREKGILVSVLVDVWMGMYFLKMLMMSVAFYLGELFNFFFVFLFFNWTNRGIRIEQVFYFAFIDASHNFLSKQLVFSFWQLNKFSF